MFDIWGYDTEDDGEGNMIGAALVNGHTDEVITTTKKWDYRALMKDYKFRGSAHVAHNSEYDIGNIWGINHLADFSKYWCSGSRFKFAQLPIDEKNSITFFDTFNHYPKSLAKIAKAMGMEKGQDPGLEASWEERKEYCIHDARIAAKFAVKLQNLYNELGTSLRATVGASAMELYQRKYMDIEYQELPNYMLQYFRQGFYGGRTECFKIGTFMTKEREKWLMENEPNYLEDLIKYTICNPIYYYDINSLYPYVMRSIKFPNPDTLIFKKNPTFKCLEYEGMSFVEVEVNDPFPVLPNRSGKLTFPNGRFKGVYPNNLLRYAQEQGQCKILKIKSTLSATESGHYLRRYIDSLYAARLMYGEDSFENLILKLLMNALYGKFGQMGKNESYNRETGQFQKENVKIPVYTNVVWSGMTTTGGYCVMHPYFDEYTFNTDTDSLMTSKRLKASQVGNELGQMKEEKGSPFDEMKNLLPKFHWLKGKEKNIFTAKGFPKEMIYDGRFPGREALERGWSAFRKPNRLRESIKRNLKLNKWEWMTKTVRAHYDKRHILPGGDTEPLEINTL